MKQLIISFIFLLTSSMLFAQQEKSDIYKGNKLYGQQKYKEAQASYQRALSKKQQSVEGSFNLGDALYKQKDFDKAGQQFNQIASSARDKNLAAGALHNLGNSLMGQKKYEESINAYKKALLNNPNDEQTRYNLAYAQEMLKKQQQQNKNNQNQNQDKKDQNKKDKDKQKQNQNQQNNNNNKDKQDQNKNQPDKQNQDQQQQQKQQQQLSKEDAQRMLDALNNNERQTQDKLKNQKLKGQKVQISKDW